MAGVLCRHKRAAVLCDNNPAVERRDGEMEQRSKRTKRPPVVKKRQNDGVAETQQKAAVWG